MKTEARELALELLERHPGWGCQRVARELARRGVVVSPMSVDRWRRQAGYAPALKRVGGIRRRERLV